MIQPRHMSSYLLANDDEDDMSDITSSFEYSAASSDVTASTAASTGVARRAIIPHGVRVTIEDSYSPASVVQLLHRANRQMNIRRQPREMGEMTTLAIF